MFSGLIVGCTVHPKYGSALAPTIRTWASVEAYGHHIASQPPPSAHRGEAAAAPVPASSNRSLSFSAAMMTASATAAAPGASLARADAPAGTTSAVDSEMLITKTSVEPARVSRSAGTLGAPTRGVCLADVPGVRATMLPSCTVVTAGQASPYARTLNSHATATASAAVAVVAAAAAGGTKAASASGEGAPAATPGNGVQIWTGPTKGTFLCTPATLTKATAAPGSAPSCVLSTPAQTRAQGGGGPAPSHGIPSRDHFPLHSLRCVPAPSSIFFPHFPRDNTASSGTPAVCRTFGSGQHPTGPPPPPLTPRPSPAARPRRPPGLLGAKPPRPPSHPSRRPQRLVLVTLFLASVASSFLPLLRPAAAQRTGNSSSSSSAFSNATWAGSDGIGAGRSMLGVGGSGSSSSSRQAMSLDAASVRSSTATAKWTLLVYMLADNNLECFGLLDLIEMMQGMAAEPSDCYSARCGEACGTGYATTGRTPCGESKFITRCCASALYPDVLVLADRGVSACSFSTSDPRIDYSMLTSTWTTARELLVMPGGSMQQVRDLGEIDMASPTQLAQFLQRAFARFPTSDANRKYALVLWDHGNGWKGYGVDDTCATGVTSASGCNHFSLATLIQGLASGLPSGRKLDILGFDACLMSMYEVAAALVPYARTLLASELLEPGHGWDYNALGAMTAAGGGAADPAALAQVWISQYKAQAVSYGTTGITLALSDLTVVSEGVVPALGAAADAMCAALTANSSLVSAVLRRRTSMATMGTGEQESSVDMGSMLTELLKATELDAASRTALTAAYTAYTSSVLAFGKDEELPAGTGVSIYFPMSADKMDSEYGSMYGSSQLLATSIGSWATFLAKLYQASTAMATSELPFAFLQSAASVPYLDVQSGSYVLQGALSSPLGLSAQVFYGFMDATDKSWILAGVQPGLVDGTRVVGTWRRLLWGVSQTINVTTPTSSSSSSASSTASASVAYSSTTTSSLMAVQTAASRSASALVFASEEWTTSADGATAISVSITATVRYGTTCSTASSRTTNAILKYTYRFATNRATLQLFAQQPSGAYGEVSAQAGGVIVPLMYKLPRDLSGGQRITYEYSGCLKWGYNGTVKVVVVGIAAAADILGVDLSEDLLMLLQTRDLSLSKAAFLVGPFDKGATADTTVGGCQCLTSWRNNGTGTLYSGCANPDLDRKGPWCPILTGSCTHPARALGPINDSSSPYDYCASSRTLSGCSCSKQFPVDSANSSWVYGRCYQGGNRAVTRGSWCTVNSTTCPSSYRAHGSNDTSYDYCEVKTVEGCYCANSWTNVDGVTYNGTCASGFVTFNGTYSIPDGFTNTSRWCRVRPGCSTQNQFAGHRIGLCGPAVPRTAGSSNTTCAVPTTVYGGVPVYDCVPWRNGPTAADRLDGVAPMCPINAGATTYQTCNTRNCTSLDLSSCPATLPQVTAELPTSAWTSRQCLQQLCAAYLIRRDNSTCTADGTRAATAYGQLNSSTAVVGVLQAGYSAASLDAVCVILQGEDCLTTTMLPACPAIRLNRTAAYDTAYVDDSVASELCSTACLRALCSVAGTRCARSRVVENLRLSLLEAMDSNCGVTASSASSTIVYDKPAALMCPELLAPASTCAQLTTLTEATGTLYLQPVTGTGQYAPLTNCTWRIQPPGLSYITLTFSAFSTESLYDTLLVGDADGPVAVLSGSDGLPGPIHTDTGLLVLTFTSDSSIQLNGFAATYNASTTRILAVPTCGPREKLAQITMRTGEYGNEASWAIGRYRITGSSSSTPSPSSSSNSSSSLISASSTSTSTSTSGGVQLAVVAAGGLLPATAYSNFSASNITLVRVDAEYRNRRVYVSYACLPAGVVKMYMYDGFGDGWTGGSLAVSYMPSGAAAYPLLNSTVFAYNANTSISVFSSMPATGADYATTLARNKAGGRFGVRFTLRLAGETSGTAAVGEAKQFILRGAVSSMLALDYSIISVVSVAAAAEATAGRRRQLYGTSGVAAAQRATVSAGSDGSGGSTQVDYLPGEAFEASSYEYDGDEYGDTDSKPQDDNDHGGLGVAESDNDLSYGATDDDDGGRTNVAKGGSPLVEEEKADRRDTGDIKLYDKDQDPGTRAEGDDERSSQQDLYEVLGGPRVEYVVHEEGVVEALLESARALGLRPATAADLPQYGSGSGDSGEGLQEEVAQQQQQRRRRQARRLEGLQDFLADTRVRSYDLTDLVSLQQPEFLQKEAEAAAVVAAAENEAVAAAVAAQKPSSAAVKSGAPPLPAAKETVDPSGTAAAGTTAAAEIIGTAERANAGDNYTVLFNGVMVDADGVPVFFKGSSSGSGSGNATTADGAADGTAVVPRALVAGAARGGLVTAATDVLRAQRSDVGGSDAATIAQYGQDRHRVVRQADAEALGHLVAAMRRDYQARARPQPGRNGGRTAVPRLHDLLPQLLRRGAAHLSSVSIALASTAADTVPHAAADTVLHAAAVDDAAAMERPDTAVASAAAVAAGSEPQPSDGNDSRAGRGRQVPVDADVAEKAIAVHTQAVSAVHTQAVSAVHTQAVSAAGTEGRQQAAGQEPLEDGHHHHQQQQEEADRQEMRQQRRQQLDRQQQQQGPEDQQKEHRRQRRRRRLEETSSPAGVDVTIVVSGYSSQNEASAAATQLQSGLTRDLNDYLGDAGWQFASPTLVSQPEVLENGQPVSSDGSGLNKTTLIIIIAAAAGGALLLLLTAVFVYLARRASKVKVKPQQAEKPPAVVDPRMSEALLAQKKLGEQNFLGGPSKADLAAVQASGRSNAWVAGLSRQQRSTMMMAMPPEGGGRVSGVMPFDGRSSAPVQSNRMGALYDTAASRGPLAAPTPRVGSWMAPMPPPGVMAPDAVAPVYSMPGMQGMMAMQGMPGTYGMPGMQGMMPLQGIPPLPYPMDPYGLQYVDPYAAMYDPYGMYGDPHVGAYPAPPAAWGGGLGPARQGWQ